MSSGEQRDQLSSLWSTSTRVHTQPSPSRQTSPSLFIRDPVAGSTFLRARSTWTSLSDVRARCRRRRPWLRPRPLPPASSSSALPVRARLTRTQLWRTEQRVGLDPPERPSVLPCRERRRASEVWTGARHQGRSGSQEEPRRRPRPRPRRLVCRS